MIREEERQQLKEEILTIGDLVESHTFGLRVRYDAMKQFFSTYPIDKRTKIILYFNLNTILSSIQFRTLHSYKYELMNGNILPVKGKQQLELEEKDLVPYQVVSILNTVAHYNHFFIHNFGMSSISTVFYLPTPEGYTAHESLVESLTTACKFIPGVHMTSRINSNITPYQAHVPTAISSIMKREIDNRKKNLTVLLLGPTPIDWNMQRFVSNVVMIDPSTVNNLYTYNDYLHSRIKLGEDIILRSDMRQELINAYIPILAFKKSIIRDYLPPKSQKIAYHKFAFADANGVTPPGLISIMRQHGNDTLALADALFDYAVMETSRSDIEKSRYMTVVRALMFEMRKDVSVIVKQMLPFWTQKLKDKSIASTLSTNLTRAKGSHSLNVEWLLEGMSYVGE